MTDTPKITTKDVSFSYNGNPVLQEVNICFPGNRIIAVTGPSGTGKSTFLTLFNRLWESTDSGRLEGKILIELEGNLVDIYDGSLPLEKLRRLVGMVFQAPNPLPMSIAKNIAFPLTLFDRYKKEEVAERVEMHLRKVHLFEEVKDRLNDDARTLSGGQQQRLCIARALILEPEVILLDEPTSSLDEKACEKVEQLVVELKNQCTLILVSHYQDQVQRIADCVYEMRDQNLFKIR